MKEIMATNLNRAKIVKREREERAWPQRQLADVAGVNLRTIQRLEKDGTASFETLMGVAQAFGMEVKQLNPTSKSQEKTASQKKVYLLPRLTTGRDLTNIFEGAHRFQVEHDEADDIRAVNAMTDIVVHIKADIVRWHDADLVKKMKIEFQLSQEIQGLEAHGFYLFGVKRTIPEIVEGEETQIGMCTIYMSHARSPKIVRDKNSNMVIPATLTEILR
ncbi:helix-turn-helix domain-containing protein [Bdellovibrio sp. HCB337]|uniref:helix-turn-helix domain-containing protein n=1 Tax=Bdellovibrio sp. HCB337 TaxID=3394358 RepID=UPI0039A4F8B3